MDHGTFSLLHKTQKGFPLTIGRAFDKKIYLILKTHLPFKISGEYKIEKENLKILEESVCAIEIITKFFMKESNLILSLVHII
jgi:hypothetical protein